MSKIYSQREAVVFLTSNGYPIHESELSRMGKYGSGPKYTKKGRMKFFTEKSLRDWLDQKKEDVEQHESP